MIDSSHVRALKGGPNPVRARSTVPSRARNTTPLRRSGILVAVSLTGGNRNDVTQLMPLIKAIPPIRGRVRRPRKRPDCLYADRGYE
ncbi:transposase [Nonomuraea ferruginea]|uniref:transposase n=1 Tax=Nonomuraea ferruginea TaxID=46174 RepID=UPI00360DF0FC